jgi:hypothetical protein
VVFSQTSPVVKGTWQWGGFSGVFCRNWFLMSPLHYLSGRSDFGFEFAEIFIFEKRLPAITDIKSRRLYVSVIWRVTNSPYRWVRESTTPRNTDTRSRRIPASPIRRVGYWIFEKKTLSVDDTESRRLPAPVIQWFADSPYCWVREWPTPRYGELTTLCIVESGSRQLRDGESLSEKKISLASIFSTLNG